jgi:hypothetical protein
MSGTTAVPPVTLGPDGFLIPTEAQILAGVQADLNAAFGGNLNPALETPQGQLATSETAILVDCNDAFLFLSQQCDPAYASGRYQDALGRIYFLTRFPAQATVVECVCTGLGNAVIPIGALAQGTDGNVYTAMQAGTIDPATGNVTIPFACATSGPIPCPPGTVVYIYQVIPGWDSITNLVDGAIGTNVESRAAFELRRQQSVALNSMGQLPSVLAAVLAVPGVLDAYVTENWTGSPLTTGGVTLVPHSLYVCAEGGADLDVATAIWTRKAPGCNYNGNTTINVEDTSSWYSAPFPTYAVTFMRPAPVEIAFEVVLQNNPQIPSDALVQIQNAILNAFAGGDGGPRAQIGMSLLASRYYCAVTDLGLWAQLLSLSIGTVGDDASFNGTISGLTLTVTAMTSGHISLGDLITGQGVLPSTHVTALGTGTGGVGTYTVSVAQLVTTAVAMSATSFGNEVSLTIAQVPVTSAGYIDMTVVP